MNLGLSSVYHAAFQLIFLLIFLWQNFDIKE